MKTRKMLWPLALLALTGCATQSPGGSTVTTVPTTSGGQPLVVAEPAAYARGEVRHTLTGKIEGVDRNAGEVSFKAQDGTRLKLRLPPIAAANVKNGDDISLDVVIKPRP